MTDDYKPDQYVLVQLRWLMALAIQGVEGKANAVNNGWSVREHEVYRLAMRDAISIVERGQ